MANFLCICLSSTLQRTVSFNKVELTKVNRSEKYRQDVSGKAINTARVLNQLKKGCVHSICPIGKENQELFIKLAQKEKLNMTCIPIPGFTRECWTILDKTNHTTTELVVSEPEIKNESYILKAQNKLLKEIKKRINHVDAVILAGSRPGIWSKNLYGKISKLTKDKNKIFLADYTGLDMELSLKEAIPSIIKINDDEFIKTFMEDETSGGSNNSISQEQLKAKIIKVSENLQNAIIVTRGIDSTFAALKGIFYECPAEKVDALNTTACGDSFNAGFIFEYVDSGNFEESLKKGTWCAARNAEREAPGTIIN